MAYTVKASARVRNENSTTEATLQMFLGTFMQKGKLHAQMAVQPF
jgi:hypothetical protein